MSARIALAVGALLALILAAPAFGEPPALVEDTSAPTADGAAAPEATARDDFAAVPSPGVAAARLVGALGVVGALLAVTLVVLRILFRGGRATTAHRRARHARSTR